MQDALFEKGTFFYSPSIRFKGFKLNIGAYSNGNR